MILLAARLGLRASDICRLKFENIHWETNTIHLNQTKTQERIELPLLAEIGNAIIDYLKYGRQTFLIFLYEQHNHMIDCRNQLFIVWFLFFCENHLAKSMEFELA